MMAQVKYGVHKKNMFISYVPYKYICVQNIYVKLVGNSDLTVQNKNMLYEVIVLEVSGQSIQIPWP